MADEEQTSAPSADDAPLTESAAAELLQDWHDEEEEKPQVDTARATANEAEAQAEAEAAEEATQQDPEPESEEEQFVQGNAKTRLRDGSEISVGELKKLADKAKEYERREAEFTAKQREVQAKAAQTAQQEQLFSQTIAQAIAVLQHTLPPEPDPALRETDPIDYFLKQDARNKKLAEIQQLQQAKQQAAKQARAEQSQHFQQRLKSEQEKLYEAVPELHDEGKRREFYGDLLSAGKHYGFSEEEMNNVHDHRIMRLVRDAVAYRKLQSSKPKVVEKAKGARPVAKPEARVSSNERISAKHKALFDRARKTRSVDDVGALLAELE